MNLKSITLENFRNYEKADFLFDPGVNLIVGDNAQGKTNLLEAWQREKLSRPENL